MDKEQAIEQLQYLGVGKREYKSLLMVPLVQVAWADGEVSAAEQKVLFQQAEHLGVHEGDAKGLLDGWIRNGPSDEYGRKARAMIRELAPHTIGLGSSITRDDLLWVIAECRRVSKAGSGIMGFFRTDPREKAILNDVYEQLDPEAIDWTNVVEWEPDEEEWDDWDDEEDSDEWEDDDDSDEWEDDDDDSDEQPAGLGLRLGVSKAKVKSSTAKKVQAKMEEKKQSGGRKRRKAPTVRDAKQSGAAAVEIKPPGFDD